MLALLLSNNVARDKKVEALETARGKVCLDHSEGEEGDEDCGNAVVLKSKPQRSSFKGAGSMEKYYSSSTIEDSVKNSSKAQTMLSTQERERKEDE
jgi:hypothetical protein